MLQNNKIDFTYAFQRYYNKVTSSSRGVSVTVTPLFSLAIAPTASCIYRFGL